MLQKLLSLFLICWSIPAVVGQNFSLYENDFESTSNTWITSFSSGPNEWISFTCAGNGDLYPGANSMYITPGGIVDGCGPGGKEQHAYDNAASGLGFALAQQTIDATCAGTLTATFEYKTGGILGEDFLELVYSLDNGGSWIPLQTLPIANDWTPLSILLPPTTYFTQFQIGFRFNFNDITVIGIAPAIDNFVITGVDTQDPVISSCVASSDVNLDNNCSAFVGDMTGTLVANDNCTASGDLIISQSPAPGAFEFTMPEQTQVFTITVEDAAGNTTQCNFTLTAIDEEVPFVSCPTPIAANLNGDCEIGVPDISTLVVWTDNCETLPASMTFTQSPATGFMVSADQTITYTVTDPYGNSQSCSTILDVSDNLAPILDCPADVSVPVGTFCFAVLGDYMATTIVTENCFFANPVTVTQSPVIGTTLTSPLLVTISAEDESGNIGQCTLTVTPIDLADPIVTCPTDAVVGAQTGCTYTLPNLSSEATVADNCSAFGDLLFSQSPAIGSVLAVGNHPITLTFEDESGNIGVCVYNLTVADITGPTVTCPANINVNVDANCTATLGDYTSSVTVTDNCSNLSNITITQSPAAGGTLSGNTQITMTIVDEENNSSTCNFFAVAVDNIDPELTCPNEVSVAINSSCQYAVPDITGAVTGTDNCSVLNDMILTQNPPAGDLETGLTSVLLTLIDEQGNSTVCISLVVPEDTEIPTVTCPSPATVINGTSCDFVLPNYGTQTLVLDNCADFSITQSPAPGTIVQAGSHVIDIDVNDAAGNLVECSFTLNITESVFPTITCPATISSCDPVVTYIDPVFNDNCLANLTQTDLTGLTSGSTFPVGSTILEYTATDLSGNEQSCSFVVTVLDFPGTATIIEDTVSLCNETSTVITAEAHSTGTGEWTVFAGQGNFNNQFANQTGVNNLLYGTNIFVYTISTTSCGNSTDTLVVIASQQPLAASTQDTIYACNTNEVILLSNPPLYGIGTWTTSDPTSTIIDINSSNTSASNLSAGWNEYIWTISNGSCPTTADTLSVFASSIADISQMDTSLCLESGTLLLSGTAPTDDQTALWKFILGGGEFDAPTSDETSVANLNLGLNTVVYVLSHPICASTSDTIVITSSLCDGFDPVFPTVMTPNFDGKNDLFVINFLEKVYPECKVTIFNRWGSVIFESVGYESPWDGTNKGEELPMGTYFYKIELNDTDNTVYTGPISIIH